MNTKNIWIFIILVTVALIAAGCRPQPVSAEPQAGLSTQSVQASPPTDPTTSSAAHLEFSLQTAVKDGRMVFIGAGGEIEGVVNPDLIVQPGDTVQVTLINGDGIAHDVSFPDFNATSALVISKGDTTAVSFDVKADQTGAYAYFCTQPGHRQAGQEGRLIVSGP